MVLANRAEPNWPAHDELVDVCRERCQLELTRSWRVFLQVVDEALRRSLGAIVPFEVRKDVVDDLLHQRSIILFQLYLLVS